MTNYTTSQNISQIIYGTAVEIHDMMGEINPSGVRAGIFPGELGQNHGCWCPVSLSRQAISSHVIDYIGKTEYYLPWGWILTTYIISVSRNAGKYKSISMAQCKAAVSPVL